MKFTRQLMLALGALVLGVSLNPISGQSASRSCASEECACEEALQKNTVEALEDFLRKYPQAVSRGESACAALAIPPGGEGAQPGENGSISKPTPPASEG